VEIRRRCAERQHRRIDSNHALNLEPPPGLVDWK
jgi:hypothetical protein